MKKFIILLLLNPLMVHAQEPKQHVDMDISGGYTINPNYPIAHANVRYTNGNVFAGLSVSFAPTSNLEGYKLYGSMIGVRIKKIIETSFGFYLNRVTNVYDVKYYNGNYFAGGLRIIYPTESLWYANNGTVPFIEGDYYFNNYNTVFQIHTGIHFVIN